mmetsp:Transcript_15556/g.40204  ORF Transcript_15556/g.40204 Transcript_15556/m.40204 type:complete len:517 (-) Transcript_15556:127-1677(-)
MIGEDRRTLDPSVAASVEEAVAAAQAHASRAALRLKTQSHCWAALTTGNTRQILDAVRALRPSTFNTMRKFVRDSFPDDPNLHHKLHALLDDEAGAITSDARQFDRVRDALEKVATTRLHAIVFGQGDGDGAAESRFEERLAIVREFLTPSRLGVAPAYCDSGAWTASAVVLRRLGHHRAPADKVALMVNACKLIERRLHEMTIAASARVAEKEGVAARSDSESQQREQQHAIDDQSDTQLPCGLVEAPKTASEGDPVHIGADEFFPVLVWVVLHATPPHLKSELAYIARFRHPDRLRGVSGCYFTHLRAAVEFLEMAASGNDCTPEASMEGANWGGQMSSSGRQHVRTQNADPHEPVAKEPCSCNEMLQTPVTLQTAAGQWAQWLFGTPASLMYEEPPAPPATTPAPFPPADAGSSNSTESQGAVSVGSVFGGTSQPLKTAPGGEMSSQPLSDLREQDQTGHIRTQKYHLSSILRQADRDTAVAKPGGGGTKVQPEHEPEEEVEEASAARLLGFY